MCATIKVQIVNTVNKVTTTSPFSTESFLARKFYIDFVVANYITATI